LNPDDRQNLHLKERQWVDAGAVDYRKENKEIVKVIEQDIRGVKDQLQQQAVEAQQSKLNLDLIFESYNNFKF